MIDNTDAVVTGFSDRVSCPVHGPVMVLVTHFLSDKGRHYVKGTPAKVEFFRCTGVVEVERISHAGTTYIDHHQCTFMRPNKWQKRLPGERHK